MSTINGLVDQESRAQATETIRALTAGKIDSDQFEDGYPLRSRDLGVKVVWWQIWGLYSDLKTERFTPEHPPSDEVRDLLDRCALFLSTDLPYAWPRLGFWGTFPFLRRLPLLGRVAKSRRAEFEAAGDPDAWPFLRRKDLEEARLRRDKTPAP
jgi:hypothetical protein